MSDRLSTGSANARMGLDASDFVHGVDQAVQGLDRIEDKAKRTAAQTKSSWKGISDGLGEFGPKAALAGGAIAFGLFKATQAASDLGESSSKAKVVFGDSFGAIETFADNAAEAIGQSKQQALEATATFGNLFRGIGQSQADAAKMSQAIVTLSGDLASFNNARPEDVLLDLRSGLLGEAEPIRKYGVLLNEAAVAAKAAEMGLGGLTGELTEAEKVQARYALILEQTTLAQGDFARTADGLANSQRIAKAEIADAEAAIGQALLPTVASATKMVAGMANAVAGLPPPLLEAGVKAAALASGLLILGGGTAKLVSSVTNTIGVLKDLSAGFQLTRASALALGGTLGATAAAAGLAIVLSQMVQDARETQAAFDAMNDSIQNTVDLAANFQLQGMDQAAEDVTRLGDAFWLANQRVLAMRVDIADTPVLSWQTAKDLAGYLPVIGGRQEQAGKDQATLEAANARATQAFQAPNLDTAKYAAAIEDISQKYAAGQIDAQGYADAVGSVVDHLVDYAKGEMTAEQAADAHAKGIDEIVKKSREQAEKTSQQEEAQHRLNEEYLKGSALALPYTRGAEDVKKATDAITESLTRQAAAAALASSGMLDLSSDVPGIQGRSKAGASIYRQVLDANRAGDISLPAGDRDALGKFDKLERVTAKLAEMGEAIANNSDDMQMWQDRIDLVDDTLGTSEDTLAEWNQQLAAGKVTQEEYNAAVASGEAHEAFDKLGKLLTDNKISEREYQEILAAGVWIRERAVGALEDEAAEQAKLLPDLKKYIEAHDDANRSVSNLTSEERGRIAALQGENAQQELQNALLIKFLEAVGQIDATQANQLLDTLTAFDPAMRALFKDEGFYATPAADTSKTVESLDELGETAKEKGGIIGGAFDLAVAKGLEEGGATQQAAGTVAENAAAEAASHQDSLYNAGWNAGYSWDAGLITGAGVLAQDVANAFAAVAGNANQAARAALQAHSPSRKSAELAVDWEQGFVRQLDASRAGEFAAESHARRMTWASARGLGAEAEAAGRGSSPAMAALRGPTTVTASFDIDVNGTGLDSGAIVDEIMGQAADRLEHFLVGV